MDISLDALPQHAFFSREVWPSSWPIPVPPPRRLGAVVLVHPALYGRMLIWFRGGSAEFGRPLDVTSLLRRGSAVFQRCYHYVGSGGVLMLRRFSIVGSTGGCHLAVAVAVGGSVLC